MEKKEFPSGALRQESYFPRIAVLPLYSLISNKV